MVDVLHPSKANLSKDEVRARLATLYKVPKETVQAFGFRTQFGGGRSTGFALVYDSEADLNKFEVLYVSGKFLTDFSHIIGKCELVLLQRLRSLLDNNGNRGRTGVRNSEERIRRRLLPPIRSPRNRFLHRNNCMGYMYFISIYSIEMSL